MGARWMSWSAAVIAAVVVWLGLAGGALASSVSLCVPSRAGQAVTSGGPSPGRCNAGTKVALPAGNADQQTLISILPYIKFVPSGIAAKPTIKFHGANVQIVNGTGLTESVNGRGNLVLGYDEHSSFNPQMSSHDLILGQNHSFTGYAQLIAGFQNTASGDYATVLGDTNAASGRYASVTGGQFNSAQHTASSVTGGELNNAYASYSSVTGGEFNEATDPDSAILGGCKNLTGTGSNGWIAECDPADTVSGGVTNKAGGSGASVSGGISNNAVGFEASISGGELNTASGGVSSVSGGRGKRVH